MHHKFVVNTASQICAVIRQRRPICALSALTNAAILHLQQERIRPPLKGSSAGSIVPSAFISLLITPASHSAPGVNHL